MRPFVAALFANAQSFSTFDGTFLGTGVTLSADKLTATFTNATFQSTRGTLGRGVGKHYFEVSALGSAGVFAAGLCKSTDAATNGIRTMANGVGWESTNAVYLQTVASATWGTYANGDTVCVAVDIPNRLIWLRKGPAGTWNNSGGADPATGVGGFGFAAITGTVFPCVSAQFITATSMKLNTGQAPFIGVRPTGFYIWE